MCITFLESVISGTDHRSCRWKSDIVAFRKCSDSSMALVLIWLGSKAIQDGSDIFQGATYVTFFEIVSDGSEKSNSISKVSAVSISAHLPNTRGIGQ